MSEPTRVRCPSCDQETEIGDDVQTFDAILCGCGRRFTKLTGRSVYELAHRSGCSTTPPQRNGAFVSAPMPDSRPVQASAILRRAVEEYQPVAIFALFSGGHDSLCSTHLAFEFVKPTAAVHINTGIGIEETREFVRRRCLVNGWRLVEMHPDKKTYDELVLEMGFPHGPKSHNTMYYWLKQRQVRRLVKEHKRSRKEKVMLVTGLRAQESVRRMGRGIAEEIRVVDGSQVWVNPILHWSAIDCNRYIDTEELEHNTVTDLLHRSGECLCGAFANGSEIREIETWFPAAAERIHALEAKCEARGLVDCRGAMPSKAPGKTWKDLGSVQEEMPLCSDCVLRREEAQSE